MTFSGLSQYYNFLWGNQIRYCTYWKTIHPNHYMPNYWLGFAYMEQGQYAKARNIYHQLLQKKNVPFSVYGNLGLIELRTQNYAESITYFEKSLELKSDIPETYLYLEEAQNALAQE